MKNGKQNIQAIFNSIFKIAIVSFITLVFFELSYRYSVIDFYKPELQTLNSSLEIGKKNIDCLVFGDSFTAWGNNYVNSLKQMFPEKTFVNTAISGIGLKEVNTFANRRIDTHQPKTIIYQVYVGNDLVDVKRLSNWKSLSLARNIYWRITDFFISPFYLNKRLAGVGKNSNTINIEITEKFSVEAYSHREKLMLTADETYLDDSITLKFDKRYGIWKLELLNFLETVPTSTKVYIVFVPHSLQVNDFYYNNMLELGANFKDKAEVQKTEYKFFSTAKNDFNHFENVFFLNPLEVFKDLDAPNKRLYHEIDPHLNTLGQKTLANYLAQRIFNP